MRSTCLCAVAFVVSILLVSTVSAAERAAPFVVPIEALELVDGTWPDESWRYIQGRDAILPWMQPRVRVEAGASEAILDDWPGAWPWRSVAEWRQESSLALRAEPGATVRVAIDLPNSDWSKMTTLRFLYELGDADPADEARFYEAKWRSYAFYLRHNASGAAWFRHEMRDAARRAGLAPDAEPEQPRFRTRPDELNDTYALFTGGRAVSENLALDRMLEREAEAGPRTIDINTIEGVTVRAMEWDDLIAGAEPTLDATARVIPEDQHALFFPTFEALVNLVDESDRYGSPLLRLFEPRPEDAGVRRRYERQLGVALNPLTRALGPRLIHSVAVTGADPYLRTGADVAVLFDAVDADALGELVRGWRHAAMNEAVVESSGSIGGVSWEGIADETRTISSYQATLGSIVVVSNSIAQLERLVAAHTGAVPTLHESPEFVFFRTRYPFAPSADTKETAFLVLTDATIRRWCSPEWRIGASRRIRAAALLSEFQASALPRLVREGATPAPFPATASATDLLGELSMTRVGVHSSEYNTLDFLTPIVELEIDAVTTAELNAYLEWKRGYELQWRRVFDPIAVQVFVDDAEVELDVSVMPINLSGDYGEFVDLTRGATIDPGDGDPHDEAIAHYVMALNRESGLMRSIAGFIRDARPGARSGPDPLGWMGDSLAIYIDRDPFWDEVFAAEAPFEFLTERWWRVPIAMHIEVENRIELAAFLTGFRAIIDQTAPNTLRWESVAHGDMSYTRIRAAGPQTGIEEEFMLCYAPTVDGLTVTLSEVLMRRALDRAAGTPSEEDPAHDWLGESLALRLEPAGAEAFESLVGDNYHARLRGRAWAALPILNEWKRLFPDQDPVEVHERWWKVRLVCPAGGDFVWNEKDQTMESTVYGHPADPKPDPANIEAMTGVRSARFGVTLEGDNLRARVVLKRNE
ncbi:MAG: hypothetical protein ACF8PN_00175 [Phycisphaerales bacterium]